MYSIKAAQILQDLRSRSPKTARDAAKISSNAVKDNILTTVFTALEQRAVSLFDLQELLGDLMQDPAAAGLPVGGRFLDTGLWVHLEDVAQKGLCSCDRAACVGKAVKVYCYWTDDLSEWVLSKRLYHSCYDEIIKCDACGRQHPRGHTGWTAVCR